MSAAVLVALINASPAIITLVLKILSDLFASGHPRNSPVPPDVMKKIVDVVKTDENYERWSNGPQTWNNPDGSE